MGGILFVVPGRPRTTWMNYIPDVFAGSWDTDTRGQRSGAKSASLETDVFAHCCSLVAVHASIGLDPVVHACVWASQPWHNSVNLLSDSLVICAFFL